MRTYCHVKCLKEVIVSFSDFLHFLWTTSLILVLNVTECDDINVMLGETDEAKDEVNNNIEIVTGCRQNKPH